MNVKQKAAIDALFAKRGNKIQPADVYNAARSPRSPLHSHFTWDKTAGWKKNLEAEARILLCQYFEVFMVDDKPIKTRAIVSLRSERQHGGGYRRVTEVLSDDVLRAQLLDDALAELSYFEAKYRRLKELAAVFEAANNVRRTRGRAAKKRAA